MRTYVCMCIYVCIYVCVCIQRSVYVSAFAFMYENVCKYVSIYV
jgi:hypothetical protein